MNVLFDDPAVGLHDSLHAVGPVVSLLAAGPQPGNEVSSAEAADDAGNSQRTDEVEDAEPVIMAVTKGNSQAPHRHGHTHQLGLDRRWHAVIYA